MTNTTPANPSYKKATTAYGNTYVNNISGLDIMLELYGGMIGNIEQAKAAYQAGKLDQMCRLNDKTIKILIALQAHLNHETGGDVAAFLNRFYNSIFASLSKILRIQDPIKEYDEISQSLRNVYSQWQTLNRDQRG